MPAMADALILAEPKSYRGLFWGGLIAGVLDISAAFVNSGLRGRSPMWVLQSIASGLLGSDSYKGGMASASLGAAVHFLIAFVAATVYYLLSRKLAIMTEQPIPVGMAYGIAVYLFMNLVVLRIVFSGRITYTVSAVIIGLIIHMVCVGLPIALSIGKFSK